MINKNNFDSLLQVNKININKNDSLTNFYKMKTNIGYEDDFFQLAEVKQQFKRKQ